MVTKLFLSWDANSLCISASFRLWSGEPSKGSLGLVGSGGSGERRGESEYIKPCPRIIDLERRNRRFCLNTLSPVMKPTK